jgi:5-formyltetrahydrofolate cyclo-ligase
VSDFSSFQGNGGDSGHDPKRDLRRGLLAARRGMTIKDRENQDAGVRATLSRWLAEIQPTTVAAYVPMLGEPGGPELPEAIADVVAQVLLPAVLPDRDLDWALYLGPSSVAPAAFGLTEPTGPRLGVDAITSADVVLVPALAVDRAGMRLGRGGGSYDRALARVRPGRLVLALLYDGELHSVVPSEPHDQRVHGVIGANLVTLLSTGH